MLPLTMERNWMCGQITGHMGNNDCTHVELSGRVVNRSNLEACERAVAVFQ